MAVKFANLASSTLSGAITNSATSITVSDASSFPTLGSGDYFYASLGEGTGSEIVKVTAVSTNTFTVTRGQDGTSAQAWSSGTVIALRVVAAALDDIASQAQTAADTESVSISGDTMTGALTTTGLTVSGNINVGEYLTHYADTDTNLRYQNNRATLRSGGGAILDLHSNGNVYLTGSTVQVYGNYSSTGTISSGALSITGKFTQDANGSVNSVAIHDDDASGQPGIHITNALTGYTKEFYLKTYGSSVNPTIFGQSGANKSILATSGTSDTGLLIGTLSAQPVTIGVGNSARITIPNSGAINFHSQSLTSIGTISSDAITSSGNIGGATITVGSPLSGTFPESTAMLDVATTTAQTNFSSNALPYGADRAQLILDSRHSSTKDTTLGFAGPMIDFRSNNSSNQWSVAQIIGTVDPENGTGHQGGLVFSTSAGGTADPTGRRNQGAAPTARMLIGAGGNVTILTGALKFGTTPVTVIDSNRNITAGAITASASGTASSPVITITSSGAASFIHASNAFAANMTAGQFHGHFFGKAGSAKNAGALGYYWAASGSDSNFVSIGHWGADHLLRLYGNGNFNIHSGALQIGGTTAIDSNRQFSGSLASSVTATTQTSSDNSTKVATTAYVDSAVSGLVDSAPSTLDTLNELAAALGDDANFSTTVTNSIATKLPLAGGTMTGSINMGANNISNLGAMDTDVAFPRDHVIKWQDGGSNYSNIIKAGLYPSQGFTGTNTYWIEYAAKGGHNFIVNTDGGSTASENSFDHFTIWQGAVDGRKLFHVTNSNGHVYSRGSFYPSNQTTNYVDSTRIANWQTAYGWGNHASQPYAKTNTANTFTALQTFSGSADANWKLSASNAHASWRDLEFEATTEWGDASAYGVLGGTTGVMIRRPHVVWSSSDNTADIRFGRSGGTSSGSWYGIGTLASNVFSIHKDNKTGAILTFNGSNTWDFKANNIAVNGTTVIDSSRNLTNIGTIGSTGEITVTNGSFNLSSGYNIQWGGSYSSGFPSIFANSSQKVLRFAPNGSTTGTVLEIDSGGLDLKVGGYEINGTTVIDSSRNLTNIASISASNDVTVNGGKISVKRGTGLTTTIIEDDSSANGRAQLLLDSHYSDMIIASRNANANKHGSNLTFATQSTSNTDFAKIVIGQGQYQEGNGLLAFAHGINQTNPHDVLGIDNVNAGVVMDVYNKRIGIGGGSSKDPITSVHVSGGRIGIASTDSSYGQIRVANTAVAEASIGFFQGFTESTLNTNNPTATNKWAIGLGAYTGTANQFVIGNVGYAGVVQVNADGKTTFGETSGINAVGRVRVGTDTSSGWGTTTKYPWIGSDGTPSLIMFQNPHVVYRTDNARSGASGRAGLRMARNSSGDWWDMGLIGDEWELYRSGTGQLLHMSNAGKMTMGLTESEFRIHGTGTRTRKIVLYDGGNTNNYQFYGFGVEGSSFINNIYATGDTFYWYAGVNSTSRQLAMSLSGTGNLTVQGTATVSDFVKASGNNLKFSAGGNHIMNIDLNGKVYPQTDNSVDLGFSATAARFRDLNLSGNIRVGGSTVIDSSRNVTANSLTVSNGAVFSDSNFAFLTTGSAAQNIRTKSVFAGTSYGDTPPAGSFNATNTYELNGTTVIDSSRNLTNIGNITATGLTTLGRTASDRGAISDTNTALIATSRGVTHTDSQTNVLRLQRDGTSGVVYAGLADIDLERWESSGVFSRTAMHFKLGHGNLSPVSDANIPTVMTLRSNGMVGVGTTAPSKPLHVKTSLNEGIFLEGTGGGVWMDVQSNGSELWSMGTDNNGWAIYNRTDTAYRLRVENGGDVDIVSGGLKVGATTVIDSSRNLTNIGAITASGTTTLSGALFSTHTGSNAIHTRFIAGAANGSTADGPLYLQYGRGQDIRMFEASGQNRKLYIYGNDNGTDRWGGLSVGTDGSFTVQASDTYLILQAASYIQSNNAHNFISSIMMSGTTVIDSSRNITNVPSISNSGGSLNLGHFTTSNADQWPYVTWLRDTANSWDEGLIKGSSSRGVFGRQHFGIHMSDQRSFAFHSSGWDTEMEVSGDGLIYMKGPVGINIAPSNSNFGPLGRKANLHLKNAGSSTTNSTAVIECGDQGESSLYLCETSGTQGYGARLYYEGLGNNFFNIEIVDDAGATKFPTAFSIDRDARVGINKTAPVGRFDVHQTYDEPSMCITSSNPGSWAASVIVGATTANGTIVDTNDRAMLIADGSYPVLNLNCTNTTNTHHGPTLQFSGNGYNSNRHWVIGTDGQMDHMDFGVSGGGTGYTSNKNPHMGISGYTGITVMRLFQNGLLVGNSLGVYPNVPTSISHQLDVRGKAKVEGTGTGGVPTLDVVNTSTATFNHSMEVIAPNMGTGQTNIIVLGRRSDTRNAGYLGYNYSGTNASYDNYISIGHWGHDNLFRYYPNGDFHNHTGSILKTVYNKAVLLQSSGTSSSGSAIGFQQITAEGWTGIFVDYNPYEGWGLYHDNPSNYFYITAENNTGGLGTSFTVPNRNSGTSTAYAKIRFDQNNGNINAGGAITANGNVTAYASDRRLKTNFRPIESAVEKVQQLNGMIFDWNDVSEKHGFVPDTKYDDIGLIAQEVQEVVPQAVDLAPFDTHVESTPIDRNDKNAGNVETKSSVSGEDYLTVRYEKLVPLLVSAIKEQADEIAELKAMIKEIKDGNH